jgi:hypothetical protein
MTPEVICAVISAIAAVSAIGISIWAIRSAKAASDNANALHEKVVEIEKKRETDREEEKKKAHLVAYNKVDVDFRSGTYSNLLFIKNLGLAPANNIHYILRSLTSQKKKEGEIPSMAPGSESSQRYGFPIDDSGPFELEITWDDDFSRCRRLVHTLTLKLS